jgi:hypothetical protein
LIKDSNFFFCFLSVFVLLLIFLSIHDLWQLDFSRNYMFLHMFFFSFIPTDVPTTSEDSSRFLNILASNFSFELCKGVFYVVHGSSRLATSRWAWSFLLLLLLLL